MDQERLNRLFKLLAANRISRTEFDELMAQLRHDPDDQRLLAAMDSVAEQLPDDFSLPMERVNELYVPPRRKMKLPLSKIAIAASLLICCSVAIWFYQKRRSTDDLERFYTEQAVKPGSNAALLTLADGKKIQLNDTQYGTLYRRSGVVITKLETGELKYEANARPADIKAAEQQVNTLSIPRGGQYQFTLPDGTKVWLNSATTLRFPAAFATDKRWVELSGEAYFEVAKNTHAPFTVKTADGEIFVTGTHFNVTAYPDERRMVTTLVEGGVNIYQAGQSVALMPGQQAVTTRASKHIRTKTVDIDYALAWVRGDFLFEDQDIHIIMKNISRWYNVDVSFSGEIPERTYGGSYTKSKGLYELIHHLQKISRLNIRLEDERRITVMP